MQKTLYQTDDDGLFLYETVANAMALTPDAFHIPYGAFEDAPPTPTAGKWPRRVGDAWEMVDDHRATPLWRVETGAPYSIGAEHDGADGKVSYPGWGKLPAWLTTQPRPDAWSVWKNGTWVRDEAAWQAEIQTRNQAEMGRRLSQASPRIAALQDAVDLDMATDADRAALLAWRRYRVAVSRVDVALESPQWPELPISNLDA